MNTKSDFTKGLKEKSSVYKMEYKTKTVKQLRNIAKVKGMRGYSRLRKADLVALVSSRPTQSVKTVHEGDLLDAPVPDIKVPTLVPGKYTPPSNTWKSRLIEANNKVRSKLNTFADWLINYVAPREKKSVNERLDSLKSTISNIFSKINKKKFEIQQTANALKGFTKRYTIQGTGGIDVTSFLNAVRPQVVGLLTKNRGEKVQFNLVCVMEKVDMKSGEVVETEANFKSKTVIILEATDVGEIYSDAVDKIKESMASYQMQGSNWRFRAVLKLDIDTVEYKPLKGNSYIPLPEYLANKKAIINPKNNDDECFKWCITRAMYPTAKNPQTITRDLIEQSKKLDWSGIVFPVAADANIINKFERNNNVSVNVFGYEKDVYPLYISKHESDARVDLLLISDGEKKHYCWIKNFNKLMSSRTEKSHNSMHYCRRCLNGYREVESLNRHSEYCSQQDAQRIELPEPGTMLGFRNYYRKMRVPFVVYADFESFIKPIDTCQPNPNTSYTNKYQKHVPSSFCYYIKCFDDNLYSQAPVMFTAENEDDDVAQIFIDTLIENVKDIYKRFKFPKRMIFGKKDKELYDSASVCHICEGELGLDRVRDHCHLTGKYRGAAHNSCNLSYKVPKFFPVVLHNLSCYDAHLFVRKLRGDDNEKINCIPCNEEKYISFSREVVVDKFINKEGKEITVKRELRFLDSFRFMPSSLDALSKNLRKEQCKNIGEFYKGRQLDLLLKKGTYPYDYVDGVERLNETELPPKHKFYSKLNDSDISDEDYGHARTVWSEFGFKTFRDRKSVV